MLWEPLGELESVVERKTLLTLAFDRGRTDPSLYLSGIRRGQLLRTPASDRGRMDPSLYLSGEKRSAVAHASLRQGEDGSKSIFVR